MTAFPLKIVTLDGLVYDGMAEELIVRTISGDMGILAGHINAVSALGMGRASVLIDGKMRYAACIGGMVSIVNGAVTLAPTTFEWAEQIDRARAERAAANARAIIDSQDSSAMDIRLAEARLKRALVRSSVARPM